MGTPRVSIIILNWNGWRDTIECLESLYRINYENYDVIIVDNASNDESIERILQYCKGKLNSPSRFFDYSNQNKPIHVFELEEKQARNGKFHEKPLYEKYDPDRRLILIKASRNYGFTGGNNLGAKFALNALNPDYVLFLNNDTVVDKDFLQEIIDTAKKNDSVGIVGSKIFYYDYAGRRDVVWALGGGMFSLKTGSVRHATKDSDSLRLNFITGCSMLVSSDFLKRVRGFDSRYFTYYEDVDLSLTALEEGFSLDYSNKSIVWHKVGATAGRDTSEFIVWLKARNVVFTIRKHSGFLLVTLLWLLTYKNLRRIANFIFLQRKPSLLLAYYKGMLDGLMYRDSQDHKTWVP
ncbi:glycosyltransferase family 2 protein [Thermococcus barossii]|uniref:Glycosyl transferase family 2 n=1 Tax=Thermococcus barossii TaxID=54077 RepID=A0A2Z2MPD8_9EURY|nr:glycosyltransferase family 2 protein [Thermococcus barossii]ASJ05724.1 glycosyl transferase family 2 [Thermococcus barossii]